MDDHEQHYSVKDGMHRGAVLSLRKKYRFNLSRVWDTDKPVITYVGLNPSVADAEKDDPTIRRLIGFSKKFGYGGFHIVNMYGLICTDPSKVEPRLLHHSTNEVFLFGANTDKVVACYGKRRNWPEWERLESRLHRAYEGRLYCFGRNKDGSPKHPLYLAGSTELELF